MIALTAMVALWACLTPPINLSSSSSDGGSDGTSSSDDGSPPLVGQFTVSGCADLTFPDGEVRCVGNAPLRITLVLIAVGATTHRWTLIPQGTVSDGGIVVDGGGLPDGGGANGSLLDDADSRAEHPQVTLAQPGTYQVTLGVAGPGGTATGSGLIIVNQAPVGSACSKDAQCQSGLRCYCGQDSPGRDGSCPGGLQAGMCTRPCDGQACPTGSLCMDLPRTSGTVVDGGSGDAWRQPMCVPSCAAGIRCRADLVCRDLPTLQSGGHAGDSYTFSSGCFLTIPGAIGDSCLATDGTADSTACVTGLCEPLGLRNLCTAQCSPGPGCPASSACATWNSTTTPAPSGPRCLQRCDTMTPCADPLLACTTAGALGPLGFHLTGELPTTTVCAPRSCTIAGDCPGGRCASYPGGSFCLQL